MHHLLHLSLYLSIHLSVHLPHLQVGFITLNRRNTRGSYLVQILHMTFLEVMTLIWHIWFELKLKRLTHKLSKIDLLPQSYSKNLLKLMISCSIEKKRIINAVSTFKYLSGLNLRYKYLLTKAKPVILQRILTISTSNIMVNNKVMSNKTKYRK